MKGFTHLHLHTEYSLLDGAAHINRVVRRAKELGMEAIAITDHGSMYGVVDFWRECKKEGIKPIIGCEVYVAPRSSADKVKGLDDKPYHLILLAENNKGYQNLIKIVSQAHIDGFYYKPRTDKDFMRRHSEGIICLSGCIQGEVQQHLLDYNYEAAKKAALEYEEIFGKGNFYLEVQNQFLRDEEAIYPDMKKLSQELDIAVAATNDVHYVNREDADTHDILLCIQTQSRRSDEDRMRFPNDEFYLKSEEEMRRLFPDLPEACDNTMEIAKRCEVDFTFGQLHLPEFIPPKGLSNSEYLRQLCQEGLYARYSNPSDELKKRLNDELEIIENMGYVEYFLIVWDFIKYARENDIMVGPGRGSAAGSVVSYCLNITSVDPMKYNLIFERFLNPERVSMPDIDVDFCYERRGEVIDYVTEKYGYDKVSQIVTFNRLKARAAIRDVARVLDIPAFKADKTAKMIPPVPGMTLDKAMDNVQELKEIYKRDPEVKTMVDLAKSIEGMPRNISVHAAGVVITKEEISNYVPLAKSDQVVVTQFPMNTIEELGLLKMDFLGLRNLTVIRNALDFIEEGRGIKIDFSTMDMDDPDVYKMIAQGNTQGIFQLESSGMTDFMKRLKPDCFEDIVAGISLFRPGPMDSIPTYIENKKNPDKITYLHPMLEPILNVTYGCLVYQEQVMQIVRQIAGYSYGRADILRRAMSKKKMDVMLSEKVGFMEGCKEHSISEDVAEQLFNQMVGFAEYAFNKSHAAAYAVLAYQTAYLKYHYPAEFMAAMITSVLGDSQSGKLARYIKNCENMGIKVLPPNINKSKVRFTVEEEDSGSGDKKLNIRFGLGAITHVGSAAAQEMVDAVVKRGPFTKLEDFIKSVDLGLVSKKNIKQLVLSGAMSDFEGNRRQLFESVDDIVDDVKREASLTANNQMDMFSVYGDAFDQVKVERKLPNLEEYSRKEIHKHEKESLGVYITGHPLDEYKSLIAQEGMMTLESDEADYVIDQDGDQEGKLLEDFEFNGFKDGQTVESLCMVGHIKTIFTKNNEQMAFVTVEDQYGDLEVVVFPKVFAQYGHNIGEDAIVRVKGKLDITPEGEPKILAESILPADSCQVNVNILKIKIPESETPNIMLKNIESIVEQQPGSTVILIYMPDGRKLVKRNPGLQVSEEIITELQAIFGEGNVKLS